MINAFSSSLNTENLKNFPNHGVMIFTWRLSHDHSIELWKDLFLNLIVKRFQRLFHVQFPWCWFWPGILYIIWKVNSGNMGLNLKDTFCTMSLWVVISWKACLVFNIFSDDLHLMPWLWSSGRFPNYWSDSCKRHNLEDVSWCVDGDMRT